ncbi:MAG: hypothetical protein JXR03_00515 [Cyclobacteriaceae bacterium]
MHLVNKILFVVFLVLIISKLGAQGGASPAYKSGAIGYSAFDKARILTMIPEDHLLEEFNDQEAFEVRYADLSPTESLNIFRTYNVAYKIIKSNDPIKIAETIVKYNHLLDWEVLLKLVPEEEENTPGVVAQPFSLTINDLKSTQTASQQIEKVGVAPTAIGGDFTTALLSATANLLIERGQKELANAFFEEISRKLKNEDLQLLVPNTAKLFESKDVYTIPSLGSTWKGAFELDIRQLPIHTFSFIEKKGKIDPELAEVLSAIATFGSGLAEGDHPSTSLSLLNSSIDHANRFKPYFQFVNTLNESLKSRRDNTRDSPWALRSDVQKLGRQGKVFLVSFIMCELKREGVLLDNLDFSRIEKLMINVEVLTDRLEKIQKAIQNADGVNADQSFLSLMMNSTKAMEVMISLTEGFKKGTTNYNDIKTSLERIVAIQGLISDSFVAIQSKDYGKVLPYLLDIISKADVKAYNEISTRLDQVKINIENRIKALNSSKYDNIIESIKSHNFQFEGEISMSSFIFQNLDLLKDLAGKDKDVKKIISEEIQSIVLSFPDEFFRIVSFISEVTLAKSEEEIKNVLDSFIMPVGSFRLKRMAGKQNLMLQGYAGGIIGNEFGDGENLGGFGGLFLPVGLSYTWAGKGDADQKACSFGFFASIVDLGAIGTYNLSGKADIEEANGMTDTKMDVQNENISLESVISPGLFFEVGMKNIPITAGVGYRFSPELRKIGETQNGIGQVALYLAVDIPLLKIYRKN